MSLRNIQDEEELSKYFESIGEHIGTYINILTERHIRLECLKIASQTTNTQGLVVDWAEYYYKYIMEGKK